MARRTAPGIIPSDHTCRAASVLDFHTTQSSAIRDAPQHPSHPRERLHMNLASPDHATAERPPTPPAKRPPTEGKRRTRVRVLVGDGHPIYREALERVVKQTPEFEFVGAGSELDFLSVLNDQRPDIALVDPLSLEIDVKRILAAAPEGTRVLCISSISGPQAGSHLFHAIADGVEGYLSKDCKEHELRDAIAIVARGGNLIGRGHQPSLAGEIRLRNCANHDRPWITPREKEILMLIADGLSAPAIARSLHLSTATVKTHQHHIYEKLDVHDRAAAVAEAMRHGLIE